MEHHAAGRDGVVAGDAARSGDDISRGLWRGWGPCHRAGGDGGGLIRPVLSFPSCPTWAAPAGVAPFRPARPIPERDAPKTERRPARAGRRTLGTAALPRRKQRHPHAGPRQSSAMVIGAGPSFGPPQRTAMSMTAGADAKRCAFMRSGPQNEPPAPAHTGSGWVRRAPRRRGALARRHLNAARPGPPPRGANHDPHVPA